MKNMSLASVMVLMFVLISGFTSVDESFKVNKKILGEWNYTVPQASYEYQKGVLVFSKDGKDLRGEVIIMGQPVPMQNVIGKKNNVKAEIDVQGEMVKLDLNFNKTTFDGTVNYSQGSLEIQGSRKE